MRFLSTWRRTRIVCGVAIGLAVCATGVRAQSPSSQKPDLNELTNRLEQLEKEMQELKGQITAAQGEQKGEQQSLSSTTESQKSPSTPPEARKATMDLYGFVMLDSGYDFKSNDPNWFDTMRPTKLPAFDGEFAPDGKVYAGVRQTRFGVKTTTPTSLGDLKTQFEFELFGTGVDAGQTTFRLRHAYGELGKFGAGQTWSPFMDIDVFPNSLEYWGPNAMVFFRNIQVRWMPIRSASTQLTFALERPGASADGGVYGDRVELQGVRPRFNLPDLSWSARFNRGWGYVQAAGIFRKISWVDTVPDAVNLSGSAFGWGLNLTSNLKFSKKDTGRFAFIYGDAIQNYLNDAPIDIGVASNPGDPARPIKGVALPAVGVISFLDHNWSDRFSTAIGYSMLDIENSNGQTPSDFHQGHYSLGNLLYHPVPSVTIGSEFQFGRRVNFRDGFNVNDYRVQFSFKYDWKKSVQF